VITRKAKTNSPGKLLLTGLLLLILPVLLDYVHFQAAPPGWSWRYAFLGFTAGCWFAIPPTIFLYTRSLLSPEFHLYPRHLGLYIVTGYNWLGWGLSWFGIRFSTYYLFPNAPEWHTYLWVASYLIIGGFFSIWSLRLFKKRSLSPKERSQFGWLRNYLYALSVAMFSSLILWGFLVATGAYAMWFEYGILTLFVVFVLLLALRSMRYSAYLNTLIGGQYGSTASSSGALRSLAQRLENHMKSQQSFLQPALSLKELAAALEVSENELSQVFTRHLKTSFYDYVNQLRLKVFEEKLLGPSARQYTITAVARECGFKSKTSLYRVFREKHGSTPSAWLKRQQPKLGPARSVGNG
ncbi:MAG: helix-turn-helix domain-containing protein, partial [Bacteroidota bacterium]